MLCFLTDYDAPVSECGDITEKYKVLRNVLLIVVPESLCKFTLNTKYGIYTSLLFFLLPLFNSLSCVSPPLSPTQLAEGGVWRCQTDTLHQSPQYTAVCSGEWPILKL